MQAFDYIAPASLADVVAVLDEKEGDAMVLAGGQTLVPTMKQGLAAPSCLVSLRNVDELEFVRVTEDAIEIGAMTTHAEVTANPHVRRLIPGLARLAGDIADRHVRNRGTIGGSLANNDPAADYPAALLALGATVRTTTRSIPAEEFFAGLFATTLEENELILSLCFPTGQDFAYRKFPNPASRYAIVGVAVARGPNHLAVTVTGAGSDGVFRWREAEDRLAHSFETTAIDDLLPDENTLMSDLHATAGYRAALVRIMTQRAIADVVAIS